MEGALVADITTIKFLARFAALTISNKQSTITLNLIATH